MQLNRMRFAGDDEDESEDWAWVLENVGPEEEDMAKCLMHVVGACCTRAFINTRRKISDTDLQGFFAWLESNQASECSSPGLGLRLGLGFGELTDALWLCPHQTST